MKLAGPSRNLGRSDLSPEEHEAVRKLIEQLKRLYGRMAECLNDVERRDGIFAEVLEKQDQVAAIIPASVNRPPSRRRRTA
jgi:hypothetical protein